MSKVTQRDDIADDLAALTDVGVAAYARELIAQRDTARQRAISEAQELVLREQRARATYLRATGGRQLRPDDALDCLARVSLSLGELARRSS